jgi:diguanylate cyclase (GGDEF)-like protein
MDSGAPHVPGQPEPLTCDSGAADLLRGTKRLIQAIQDLSLVTAMSEIQEIVRVAARDITQCDGATFILREPGVAAYVDEDAIAPLFKGKRFQLDHCISGWVMVHKQVAAISDIYQDPRIPHEIYRPTFVKSLVMAPIRRLNPLGAIGNYWAELHQPTEYEVELVQMLADAAANAIDRVQMHHELEQRVHQRTRTLERLTAKMYEASLTDDLTRLLNRHGFMVTADEALRSAVTRGDSCVVAYLDVDGLKTVNDEHGHNAGDELLRDVAKVLVDTLRRSDILGRRGDDEFCVFAAEPTRDPGGMRNRIYRAFDRFNETHTRPYRASVSVGLAELTPSDSDSLEDLIAHADADMYEQKRLRKRAESHRGRFLRLAPTGPETDKN